MEYLEREKEIKNLKILYAKFLFDPSVFYVLLFAYLHTYLQILHPLGTVEDKKYHWIDKSIINSNFSTVLACFGEKQVICNITFILLSY